MRRSPKPTRLLGRRPRRTREEVYRAAVELFMHRGVNGVTMQQIADHAETARSTVFNHYPNKVHLLDEFFRRFAARILDLAQESDAKTFRQAMHAYYDAIGREARACAPILRDIADLALRGGPLAEADADVDVDMLGFLSRLVARGARSGDLRRGLPVTATAELLLALVTATNHEWVSKGQKSDLAADHKRRFDLVFRGLGPR